MHLRSIRVRFPLFAGICAVAFCSTSFLIQEAYASPSPVQAEIAHLQDLSETQHDDAIKQLQDLLQQLPANAAPADRRELLLALIPLYIDAGDKQKANALNANLATQGQQFHDQVASAMAMTYQARLLKDEGNLGKALEIIEQTLAIAKQVGENRLNNQVHSMAGELYLEVGNFQTALQHQQSAMDALDEGGRQSELRRAKTLNNISRLYLRLKDPKMALDYNARAADVAKKIGAGALMANIATNRGYALADQEQWEPAIVAYKESLKIAHDVGDLHDEAISLSNMSDAAMNQGNYSACVQYAQQAIAVAQKGGKGDVEAVAFGNLGVCHMSMGAVAQGAAEAKRGIEFSRKANALPTVELALGDLAAAYEKAGMYQDALKAMHEQRKLSTELFRAERDRSVTELQARFDASERQKQIEALEQKNLLQHADIENKSLQRVIAILATMIALAAAITIFLLYRKVRRSNRRLRDSNLELKHKSTRDPLTGLLNRRAFQDLMKSGRPATKRADDNLPGLLVLLDIDHFKHINDTRGHAVVGSSPIGQDGHTVAVTVSAGYILMPLPGVDDTHLGWETALHLSDIALYMAKSGGRNQAIGIERATGNTEQIRALVEGDLQGAVDQGVVTLQRIAGPLVESIIGDECARQLN